MPGEKTEEEKRREAEVAAKRKAERERKEVWEMSEDMDELVIP